MSHNVQFYVTNLYPSNAIGIISFLEILMVIDACGNDARNNVVIICMKITGIYGPLVAMRYCIQILIG